MCYLIILSWTIDWWSRLSARTRLEAVAVRPGRAVIGWWADGACVQVSKTRKESESPRTPQLQSSPNSGSATGPNFLPQTPTTSPIYDNRLSPAIRTWTAHVDTRCLIARPGFLPPSAASWPPSQRQHQQQQQPRTLDCWTTTLERHLMQPYDRSPTATTPLERMPDPTQHSPGHATP
jgi:hypothetical protein